MKFKILLWYQKKNLKTMHLRGLQKVLENTYEKTKNCATK